VEGRNILFDVAWDVDRGRYLVMEGKVGQVVDTTDRLCLHMAAVCMAACSGDASSVCLPTGSAFYLVTCVCHFPRLLRRLRWRSADCSKLIR